jgi:GNAT superfamily N-acetyltransferase
MTQIPSSRLSLKAGVSLHEVRGNAIGDYIDALAQLRIAVFREYPYLYDGDMTYERAYLAPMERSTDALVMLVRDETDIVGFVSATPLNETHQELREPFTRSAIDPARVFYLAEFVLLPFYRGRGLGKQLMAQSLNFADTLNRENRSPQTGPHQRFDFIALCAVDRSGELSSSRYRPPADYHSPDPLWRSAGFRRAGEEGIPSLTASFSWREVGHHEESLHPMIFWLKPLVAHATIASPPL